MRGSSRNGSKVLVVPSHDAHTRAHTSSGVEITSWCNWVRKVKRKEAREKTKVTVRVRRLNGSELGRKMGKDEARGHPRRGFGGSPCGETKQRPAS